MAKKVMLGAVLVMMFSVTPALPVHAFEIGQELGVAYYTWKEYTSLGTLKESGPIWTLGWTYASSLSPETRSLRGHARIELFWGQVDYDTVALNLSTGATFPVNTDTRYLGLKLEWSAGWPIVLKSTNKSDGEKLIISTVEPFVGLAFRFWDRVIENSSNAGGGIELYRNLYARLGVSATQALNESITIYGSVSADPMLWAQQEAGAGGLLSFNNGRRPGWEIEAGARFRKINIATYWQATRFGKSDVVSGFLQPKSNQDIIGIKFGYLF